MHRIQRIRPVVAPSLAILATLALLALLALSLAVQPPHVAGADRAERVLGWARASLFTAGALAFLVGLIVSARAGSSSAEERTPVVHLPAQHPLPVAFTLVALGGSPEDTRAIADAPDGAAAIRILWEWSEAYPAEHVVIFNAEGEPIAFRRPARVSWLARRGAA